MWGSAVDLVSRHLWRAADEVVLVTSPDNVAVMDAYASVKSHCDDGKSSRIATLVNQAMDALTAQDAHARLQRACHRFLSVETRVLGSVPMDATVRAAAVAMRPLYVHAPHCAAALELSRNRRPHDGVVKGGIRVRSALYRANLVWPTPRFCAEEVCAAQARGRFAIAEWEKQITVRESFNYQDGNCRYQDQVSLYTV